MMIGLHSCLKLNWMILMLDGYIMVFYEVDIMVILWFNEVDMQLHFC